ncbi:homeobox protein prophet of Pit-1-like, partial [Sinocyclocheilus grahami]|uniref:homeobox protein prophet of Pit-1-like n=1 Tax=Sinocyclocheilus grahami TaxID=75366 RepID=UPI0007AD2A42
VWFQNRRAKQRKQDRVSQKVLPVGMMPGRGPLFSSMCVSPSAMSRQYQCPHSLPHIPRFSSVLSPGGYPPQPSSGSAPSSHASRQPDDWYSQLRSIGPATTSVLSLASVSTLETTSHWN